MTGLKERHDEVHVIGGLDLVQSLLWVGGIPLRVNSEDVAAGAVEPRQDEDRLSVP
jgi:hypothetical protein